VKQMACPRTELQTSESGNEIQASFKGVIGAEGAAMLRSLAGHVRGRQPAKVVLDISHVESIEPEGLPGLLELDQAAADVKGRLEIRATGPRASELLAMASLGRAIGRGR